MLSLIVCSFWLGFAIHTEYTVRRPRNYLFHNGLKKCPVVKLGKSLCVKMQAQKQFGWTIDVNGVLHSDNLQRNCSSPLWQKNVYPEEIHRQHGIHHLETLAVHEGAEAFVGLDKFFGLLLGHSVELRLQIVHELQFVLQEARTRLR